MSRRRTALIVITLLSTAFSAPGALWAQSPVAAESAASADQIAAWIGELDSREYRVRERATRKLLEAGALALDPLLSAANGERPEPADRAIWVLQQLSQSQDRELTRASLSQLTKLRDRPNVAALAEAQLTRIDIVLCERHLKSLGADCGFQIELVATLGAYVPVFRVKLDENWRGKSEDLRPLADLHGQQHIVLEGPPIDDAVIKLFESRPSLAWMHLLNTKVSVAAIDALKVKHPNADVYLKNHALMGVSCQNHAAGAIVKVVQPGEAAHAAGVLIEDVVVAIDGQKVPDFDRLTAHVAQHKPGDKIVVEVLRAGEKRTLEVTLGSWAEYDQRRR